MAPVGDESGATSYFTTPFKIPMAAGLIPTDYCLCFCAILTPNPSSIAFLALLCRTWSIGGGMAMVPHYGVNL